MEILFSNRSTVQIRVRVLRLARIVLSEQSHYVSLRLTITTNDNLARLAWLLSRAVDISIRVFFENILSQMCSRAGNAVTLMTDVFLFGEKEISCYNINHYLPSRFLLISAIRSRC